MEICTECREFWTRLSGQVFWSVYLPFIPPSHTQYLRIWLYFVWFLNLFFFAYFCGVCVHAHTGMCICMWGRQRSIWFLPQLLFSFFWGTEPSLNLGSQDSMSLADKWAPGGLLSDPTVLGLQARAYMWSSSTGARRLNQVLRVAQQALTDWTISQASVIMFQERLFPKIN